MSLEYLAAKAKGDELFKANDYSGALSNWNQSVILYKKADSPVETDLLNLHKNIAAAHLKLGQNDKAVQHCDIALAIFPGDVKALFRRSQAHEALDNVEDAFKDVTSVLRFDPKNAAALESSQRLLALVSAKINTRRSTAGVALEMIKNALTNTRLEARIEAAENLVVLARDRPGAEKIIAADGITQLLPLIDDKEEKISAAILWTFSALAAASFKYALLLLQKFLAAEHAQSLKRLIESKSEKLIKGALAVLSSLLESLSAEGVQGEAIGPALDAVIVNVTVLITSKSITGMARDGAIAAIIRNIMRSDVAKRFMAKNGIRALLQVASNSASPLFPSTRPNLLEVTRDTRMEVSVGLAKICDATKVRSTVSEQFIADCVREVKFGDEDSDVYDDIPAAFSLTAITQGIAEVGNTIMEAPGVMMRLMKMAQSTVLEAQCAAAEAIAHAASDKKRCRGVLMEGVDILKKLYARELPDGIRVRALVGLCKMGAQSGGNPKAGGFSEGSMVNLAKKLRPFLVGKDVTIDSKQWAAEGLAYLTLDADVKEYAVHDPEILAALLDVCNTGDKSVQFSMANMLVNVTNTYDKPEQTEEREAMEKIGKLAGENIPEPSPKDSAEFVDKRVQILIDSHFVTGLVTLSKTESEACKEQIARVFLGMIWETKNRGIVIQQGGAKALLPLAREGTAKGMLIASQGLAKLAITADPSIAFPGQRSLELVRPLIKLIQERNGLMQFEGCMALCNLASMNEDLRHRILREDGVKWVDSLLFDEDPLVRRAAVQVFVNLFESEEISKMYGTKEGRYWQRIKLFILLSGIPDEEYETSVAASACVSTLSTYHDVIERIFEERQGVSILKELISSGDAPLQLRGLSIMGHLIEGGSQYALKLREAQGLELLIAVKQLSKNDRVKAMCEALLDLMAKHVDNFDLEEAQKHAAKAFLELQAQIQAKRDDPFMDASDSDDEEKSQSKADDKIGNAKNADGNDESTA